MEIYIFYIINEAHKQYSLLDTTFNYIFYLEPPGKHLYLSLQNPLHVAGEAGRCVVGFIDCFIDVFLEVQHERQLNIVYNRLYCLWASFMI